jgi:hypothetical protein
MLSKDYILGFVEGEGCFSITIQKNIDRKPRLGKWVVKKKNPFLLRVSPTFRITNVEANLPLLEEIKSILGVGSIYLQKRGNENSRISNVAYYYTKSLAEALKIKEFFGTLTFNTTKGKDFVLWSKCLEIIAQKRHLTKEGLLEICQLRDQMNFRPTKNKWSTEEVRKILGEKPVHILAHVDPNQQQLIHNSNSAPESWLSQKQGNSKPNRFVSV